MKDVSKKESARILLEGIDGVRADYISEARIVQKDKADTETAKGERNRKLFYITESLIAAAAIAIIGFLFWNVLRNKDGEAIEGRANGTYSAMEWPVDAVHESDEFYKSVFAYVDPENVGIDGFRDDFGGLYYSEGNRPIVVVTGQDAVDGYKRALSGIDHVSFDIYRYSYKELVKISEEAMGILQGKVDVKERYIDSSNNLVRIWVSSKEYEEACEIVKEMPVLIIREEMAIEQATEMETE